MKKLIRSVTSAVLAAAMAASCLASSGGLFASAAQAPTQSDGVYQVATADDLLFAAQNPQNNYRLMNDIDLSGISDWTAIGTESDPYSGVFNGQGHTVTLGINQTKTENGPHMIGLFGCVSGTVANLTVSGKIEATIHGGYIGSVASNLAGGTLINCVNNAPVTVSGTAADKTGIIHIGGVAGAVRSGFACASVKNCINNGAITYNSQKLPKGSGDLGDGTSGTVGGILGYTCTGSPSEITNCVNNGAIDITGGTNNVGGILGMTSSNNNNSKANITFCANKGNITIKNLQGERTGGITGYIKNGKINYCYNLGNVLAYSDDGVTPSRAGYGTNYGIFGYANINDQCPLEVKYCYNASEVPLEAEICLIRNAKYGTFKNFYMQGREEYELELRGESGNPGTPFTSADDLLTKITADAQGGAAYTANPEQGGYPVLQFETACELENSGAAGEIKAEDLGGRLHNLYFAVQIPNADVKDAKISAAVYKGDQKTDVSLDAVNVLTAGGSTYKAASGCSLFGAVLYSASASWTLAEITVSKDGKTLFTKSITNKDSRVSVEIPFDGIPDYPEGTISSVYNAGPGIAVDDKSVTAEDSKMVIISKTYKDTFNDYINSLLENGFVKISESEFEGNQHYYLQKGEQKYYMYYTAYSNTVRIIQENSSNALPSKLDADPVGTSKSEFYLYSIDYTLGDGQYSPTNYWSVDCGALLIIKLADNSVFIVDGGHMRQSSKTAQESFVNFLYEITGKKKDAGEKVRIKGWFFSHAHDDHTYFSEAVVKNYHDNLQLDSILFNFPSYQTIKGGYATTVFGTKKVLKENYPDCNVVKLHTGQQFSIQGVDFDVLFTHEDAVSNAGVSTITDFNSTSTVLKVTMDGKSFTLLGDCSDKGSELLLKMYTSKTLHSDCVQVAHHNYNLLPNLYKAIGAKLALFCNSEINAGYNSGNREKYLAVINAADGVEPLFAYPDNYKITVEENELVYVSTPGYRSAFEILSPPPISPTRMTDSVGFKEDLDYVIKNKTPLLDKVIDRSVIGTNAADRAESGYCILDGDLNTKFSSNLLPASVVWTMKEPTVVNSYVIYTADNAYSYPKRNPKKWALLGSNDGSKWDVIDSVNEASLPKSSSKGTAFKVDKPGEYLYYSIRFFATEGLTPLQVAEISLYNGVTDEIQSVIDSINNIPAAITIDDEDIINAAKAAFDKLTDEQKAKITNKDVLTAAQSKLEELKKPEPDPTPDPKPDPTPTPTPTPSHPSNGIAKVNGKTVLYKDGKAVTGTVVVTVSGKTYAVVGGYVKTGTKNQLVKIGKNSYVVNKSGIVIKSSKNKLVKVGKKSYIVNKKGVVIKGKGNKLVKVGKKKYIVNKKGVVYKNKKAVKVGKKTYKVNKKGIATKKK